MALASIDNAAQLAQRSVDLVEKKFGFRLPYNPESLLVVDAIIDKIRETGASQQQASGLLLGLGCYTGETLVRHARAAWRPVAQLKEFRDCGFPIVLSLPGGKACNPIGAVFDRFAADAPGSLGTFYEAAIGLRSTAPRVAAVDVSGGDMQRRSRARR